MRRCTQVFVKIAFAMVVGMLSVPLAGFTDARAQNPFPAPIFPPPGFVIPPADQPCILGGNRLDLQCIIANDPDAQRIRAEEAALFAEALAASQGMLDPFHQIEPWESSKFLTPTSPSTTTWPAASAMIRWPVTQTARRS